MSESKCTVQTNTRFRGKGSFRRVKAMGINMDNKKGMDENLFISSLSVQLSEYDTAHHFEVKKRKVHNSFGLILDGTVSFFTLTERVDAKEGDLIFVPEGIRYSSCWAGNPKIRFVNIHFRMLAPASPVFRSMRIRKIEQVGENIQNSFRKMMDIQLSQDVEQMTAIAEFYSLCSRIYPLISDSCNLMIPPALQRGMEYINENFCTVSRVSEISKACYLSESHLYHMFQEYLGTSPVAYLNSLRIQKAMELLITTDKTIEEIAAELGFHSGYYFRKTFKSVTGVLPSKYRKYT